MVNIFIDLFETLLKSFLIRVMKHGPIPQHIAFILDGNRRYARKTGMAKACDGHRAGYHKLGEILNYCLELGIPEATLFLFSTENFKRSQEEVDGLMNLIVELVPQYSEKLKKQGARVNVIGNWTETFPDHIKAIFADTMESTRNNKGVTVNLAISYTAREEITSGVQNLVGEVSQGTLSVSDVDEKTLEECFQVYPTRPVDLLLRTSGETRLSDFLLWQASHAYLDFIPTQWPDLTYRELMTSILKYQRHILCNPEIEKTRYGEKSAMSDCSEANQRQKLAIELIRAKRWKVVESHCTPQ